MTKRHIHSSFSSQKIKKSLQYFILFLWISLTLHLYAFWGVNTISLLKFQNIAKKPDVKVLSNIILETKTESNEVSKSAAISDKNNRNQAPQQDLSKPEEYNFANPNIAKNQGAGGDASYIPQKEIIAEEEQQKPLKQENVNSDIVIKNSEVQPAISSQGGGETAPTLFDIKKPPVVNLYNVGLASFATQSKEYADYFIKMKNKIEKYHKEFFPIYQYYQGLLKDGEVVIEYSLDQSGNVTKADIISSYGSETVDQASLNSIVYSRNFGQLPKDFDQYPEITIRFHFIYKSR